MKTRKIRDGNFRRALQGDFVTIVCDKKGISFYGTDHIERGKYIIRRDATLQNIRIPMPIRKAYGIKSNDIVEIEELGNRNFRILKPLEAKRLPKIPEHINMAYDRSAWDDLENLPVTQIPVAKKIHLPMAKDDIRVIIDTHNRCGIKILLKDSKGVMSEKELTEIYGSTLKSYPFEKLVYKPRVKDGYIALPDFFMKEVDGIDFFNLVQTSDRRWFLMPDAKDGFTKKPIDFTKDKMKKVELCEDCTPNKDEIDDVVASLIELKDVVQNLTKKVKEYESRYGKLSETKKRAKKAQNNEVLSLKEALKEFKAML